MQKIVALVLDFASRYNPVAAESNWLTTPVWCMVRVAYVECVSGPLR